MTIPLFILRRTALAKLFLFPLLVLTQAPRERTPRQHHFSGNSLAWHLAYAVTEKLHWPHASLSGLQQPCYKEPNSCLPSTTWPLALYGSSRTNPVPCIRKDPSTPVCKPSLQPSLHHQAKNPLILVSLFCLFSSLSRGWEQRQVKQGSCFFFFFLLNKRRQHECKLKSAEPSFNEDSHLWAALS